MADADRGFVQIPDKGNCQLRQRCRTVNGEFVCKNRQVCEASEPLCRWERVCIYGKGANYQIIAP